MGESEIKKEKLIFREDILIRLTNMFQEDFRASMAEFPKDKKIEFVRYLWECFDLIESPTTENWNMFTNKEHAFLKKHGNRLKVYNEKGMNCYFERLHLLLVKPIYTEEERSSLNAGENLLSMGEFATFFRFCRNVLTQAQNSLLPEQKPEDIITNKTFELKNKYLKDVYDKLKPDYINCKVSEFKKVFSGEIITEEEKIRWLGTRASLHYFLTKTFSRVSWKIADDCFRIEGKSLEGNSLKNDKSISRKDKENINKAISQFQFPTS